MPSELSELRPYKSVVVSRALKGVKLPGFVAEVMANIGDLIRQEANLFDVNVHDAEDADGIEAAFLEYREEKKVPWLLEDELSDTIHQLVVLCRYKSLFAIHASATAIREKIRARLGTDHTLLGKLEPIEANVLNAVFVSGEAQTLWLSGTHRRVTSKVDNKILSGLDLRYALDPLGDQSYFFTAARCRPTLSGVSQVVGISPRKSSVWMSSSKSWMDFRSSVKLLLENIARNTVTKVDPLPVLATSFASSKDLSGVRDAYDASLIPPELLEGETEPEIRQTAEKWSGLRFEIIRTVGADFEANLLLSENGKEEKIGRVSFAFDFSRPEAVQWNVTGKASSKAQKQPFEEILGILKQRRTWLKVWYETGHTLTDQTILRMRYRDQPFRNYRWADLQNYKRKVEKPSPLSAKNIGKQKSLFCWIKNHWLPEDARPGTGQGWLASNDGSMEIADFIHLETRTEIPTLTLIHVKGAKSDSANRRVSVSPYEIVTGQAVKNLRHLDQELVADNFAERLDGRIKEAVWFDGAVRDRAEMLEELKKVNANYRRRVIILQPHLRKSAWQAAQQPNAQEVVKLTLRQLDTLLLSAQASCQALGAEFFVLGDDV